jgi:hypothetical protein
MIDSSFEVILCYKAHPGKEINDSGGEFPGDLAARRESENR